uniref:Calcium-independent phospholipase A2-gamma n=1 Tax=Geotrypetes seraphini TaxID=260995 RepID=A0A6P8SE60_GEOSA|nr:calcium-independent phospholipase A2-gamma [Geotrypetes seraphini]XP_033815024.1 calcium-independent phospholipase A2-gamma [Geotrypetes seraphini]XP_033815025.1 calcium-independent phospholipase A2-gamma [Geotrypetes seraphini]XP_033815026.1 calcium-independent phospholipase A2-gamma [Geotrypetes seraphini]
MTVNLLLSAYLYICRKTSNLWQERGARQLCFLYSPVRICSRLSHAFPLRGIHTGRFQRIWSLNKTLYVKQNCVLGKLDLYWNTSNLSSSSREKPKANNHMSQIKSTLDSVSKAAVSTYNELIARFKSTPATVGKAPESKDKVKQESLANSLVPGTKTQEDSKKTGAVKKPVHAKETSQESSKNNSYVNNELFHENFHTTNFGETYDSLENHINLYFDNYITMPEDTKEKYVMKKPLPDKLADKNGKASMSAMSTATDFAGAEKLDKAISVPTKSSSHFLLYPFNRVQAFVGYYFGGVVPRLWSGAKDSSENESKDSAQEESGRKGEHYDGTGNKSSEDISKRLSLQRKKIIVKVSVDNRTRALVQAIRRTSDRRLLINRVEELSCHILEFPETNVAAVKEKAIPYLLTLKQTNDDELQAAIREALALIGYTDPVKGRGIRLLSLDGGGTRGVLALQILKKFEELTGKPVYQLFDYICGVSTGAIIAFMLGLFRMPISECEELYWKLSSDIFKQNVIVGTVKMGWSHAFYDSETWEKMLKERLGSGLIIETSRNIDCPKVAAVSTLVNRGVTPKAFVFRNYNHLPGSQSHYLGGCQYNLWQAIRASSAAPGYFQEYVLGEDLHQDGGLLINNPCALALHEVKCIWPNVPLQSVISLGTGRFEHAKDTNVTHTSLKAKLNNVISSATNTEEVHIMLEALLPPDTYFRFNPFMNEGITLDENRKEKLSQLRLDGINYIERNEKKLKKAVKILLQEKTARQKVSDWLKLKTDMYEGFPFFSRL